MKLLRITFILLLFSSACTKSNEKLIIGTWKVTKVMEGSKDVSSEWLKAPYREVYTSDGNYSYTGQPNSNVSGTGKYTWDNSTLLKRNGVSGQSSYDITITNLTKSVMEYNFSGNGSTWTWTFSKE